MAHNATSIILQVEDTKLIGELSQSLNSAVDAIDISSKAGGRVREILPGRISESISFESLADDTNSTDYGYDDLYTAMAAGTLVSVKILRVDTSLVQVDPSLEITGNGYISSLTLDNPDNDRSTMSGTIEIDGDLTVTTYNPA
jgi:hypothetical protein